MAVTIVSWNVNSVKARFEHLCDYLKSEQAPDIVLLQELKCETSAFPKEEIEDFGYNSAVIGQKTYNGVAILSKYPIDDVLTTLPGEEEDQAARYIEAVISLKDEALRVASIYVPNGKDPESDRFDYKMRFLDRLYTHAQHLLSYKEILVLGGDYNIAPTPLDVYHPKHLEGSICFHPKERAQFRRLESLDLLDAYRLKHRAQQEFTWWDYRGGSWQQNKGMRIDHLMLSPEAAHRLEDVAIHKNLRSKEKPSDHAPIWCSLG